MNRKQKTETRKRKFSKIPVPRKDREAKIKTRKARKTERHEPYIVSSEIEPQCPRCSEKVSIQLEKTFTSGTRYFRCFSEECKKNSVRPGRGRGFVVPVGKANCKKVR
ncbi:MAG: hypothetical protein WC373_01865 [Smithella sp.]|jgi:hypothetical protein